MASDLDSRIPRRKLLLLANRVRRDRPRRTTHRNRHAREEHRYQDDGRGGGNRHACQDLGEVLGGTHGAGVPGAHRVCVSPFRLLRRVIIPLFRASRSSKRNAPEGSASFFAPACATAGAGSKKGKSLLGHFIRERQYPPYEGIGSPQANCSVVYRRHRLAC